MGDTIDLVVERANRQREPAVIAEDVRVWLDDAGLPDVWRVGVTHWNTDAVEDCPSACILLLVAMWESAHREDADRATVWLRTMAAQHLDDTP